MFSFIVFWLTQTDMNLRALREGTWVVGHGVVVVGMSWLGSPVDAARFRREDHVFEIWFGP